MIGDCFSEKTLYECFLKIFYICNIVFLKDGLCFTEKMCILNLFALLKRYYSTLLIQTVASQYIYCTSNMLDAPIHKPYFLVGAGFCSLSLVDNGK